MSAKISAKFVKRMYADYSRGMSSYEVGRKYGRSDTAVRRLFKLHGLARRELAVPESLVRKMHADYVRGMSLAEVGVKYKRNHGVVGAIFARRGLKVRTRGEALLGKKRPGVKQPLRWPLAMVKEMHAAYLAGTPQAELARRYGKNQGSLLDVFRLRGLEVRENPRIKARMGPDGCFLPGKRATKKEIAEMVRGLKRIVVPPALKAEWRHWTLERRGEFVRQVRASLEARGLLAALPAGRLSRNVRRWDYGTRAAHEIAARVNEGHCSRTMPVKIKLGSAGLIWNGRLWSWAEGTGYLAMGQATAKGREMLHHAVWTEATGEHLPRPAVLRMKDGNWNNLNVANMERMSRNELARENQAAAQTAKSRALTAALLQNHQRTRGSASLPKQKHEHSSNDIILELRKRSARIETAADGR